MEGVLSTIRTNVSDDLIRSRMSLNARSLNILNVLAVFCAIAVNAINVGRSLLIGKAFEAY